MAMVLWRTRGGQPQRSDLLTLLTAQSTGNHRLFRQKGQDFSKNPSHWNRQFATLWNFLGIRSMKHSYSGSTDAEMTCKISKFLVKREIQAAVDGNKNAPFTTNYASTLRKYANIFSAFPQRIQFETLFLSRLQKISTKVSRKFRQTHVSRAKTRRLK
ncbi:MAG: hypothetical protein AAFY24_07125 [Pseudomonadota bacterium]